MGKLKAFNQRIFHSQYSIMMIKFWLACSLFIYHVRAVGVEQEEEGGASVNSGYA